MPLTLDEVRACTMAALTQPPAWPEDNNYYAFKFTIYIDGSSSNPLLYNGPYVELTKGIVFWGDGSNTEYENVDDTSIDSRSPRDPSTYIRTTTLQHQYQTPGKYQVTILSDSSYNSFRACWFPKIRFSGSTSIKYEYRDNVNLISIDSPIPLSSLYSAHDQLRYSDPHARGFVNNFLFTKCINLNKIHKDLFKYVRDYWKEPKYIKDDGTMVTLKEQKPSYNETVIDLFRGSAVNQFSGCTSLKSIPIGLYKNTGIKSASSVFNGCRSLVNGLDSIFENCDRLYSLSSAFEGCVNLKKVPGNFIKKCKIIRSLTHCFYGCSGLTEVENFSLKDAWNDSFSGNDASISYCFYGCTSLKSIPDCLFSELHVDSGSTIAASYCFYNCKSLTKVPKRLFYDTDSPAFIKCFSYCSSITEICDEVFASCKKVTTFEECFSHCTALTIISDTIFVNCESVKTFYMCFYSCLSIESIPENLFSSCLNVTSFRSCFDYCKSITHIPERLFSNCPLVTNFRECFSDCESLLSIPERLFENCPLVTTFYDCFFHCAITSIPEGLFSRSTKAITFTACFMSNIKLEYVPETLFDNCESATNFGSCFASCSSINSFVPELWIKYPNADGNDCYLRCTKALNYSDIPSSWR